MGMFLRTDWGAAYLFFSQKSPSPLSGYDADEQLMVFVNLLGVVTFLSIVFYHFVTAKESDAI